MTHYDTPAEHRHKANRGTLLLFLIVIAACLAVILLYHPGPADASSYVHLDACKSSLRGGGGSDNDVQRAVAASGSIRFVGWSTWYTRVSATDVRVKGLLAYPRGRYLWWTGRCIDHDYGLDSFS